jgi:hypothetical protein
MYPLSGVLGDNSIMSLIDHYEYAVSDSSYANPANLGIGLGQLWPQLQSAAQRL